MTTQARLASAVLVLCLCAAADLADEPGGAPPPRPEAATEFHPGGPDDPRLWFAVVGIDRATLAALARDPRAAREVLSVFAGDAGDPTPLLGKYEVDLDAGRLRFVARFPVEPGVRYRVAYRPPGSQGAPRVASYRVAKPKAAAPTTQVVRVAPAGDVLPENLLKFYVEFSAPMGRGEAYEHVRLLDASGKSLDLPFLELGEELWDPRGVRFTLLFDPGRIKRGLKPREELGPVLEAGKTYTLVIDRGWHDAAGSPLKAEFRKTFRAGPPDTTPPDPAEWSLGRPEAGTRGPLVVTFPEPLDRAMLGRVLAVTDPGGKPLAGAVAVGRDERTWSLTPDAPWRAGHYTLLADRALEDLAGNSIGRPFEVDVFRQVERRETAEAVALPFEVGPGGP